jgi:hypothetical protein
MEMFVDAQSMINRAATSLLLNVDPSFSLSVPLLSLFQQWMRKKAEEWCVNSYMYCMKLGLLDSDAVTAGDPALAR